jgi:hypothetical protein
MPFDSALGNGKQIIRPVIGENKSSNSDATCSTKLEDNTGQVRAGIGTGHVVMLGNGKV